MPSGSAWADGHVGRPSRTCGWQVLCSVVWPGSAARTHMHTCGASRAAELGCARGKLLHTLRTRRAPVPRTDSTTLLEGRCSMMR